MSSANFRISSSARPNRFLTDGGKGPSLHLAWTGGSEGHLCRWCCISLLLIADCIMEQSFQEEQPPLLAVSDTPVWVVLTLFIQKELPPQSSFCDSFRTSGSFGENLYSFTEGSKAPIMQGHQLFQSAIIHNKLYELFHIQN